MRSPLSNVLRQPQSNLVVEDLVHTRGRSLVNYSALPV